MFTRCRKAVLARSTSPRTKAGIHFRGFGECHRGAGQGVLTQHGFQAGDERDLGVAYSVLGQTHSVPRVGPGGLEIDGPLELRGSVIKMRVATQLTQTEGEKPQLEMQDAVGAVGFRRIDQPLFEREQAHGVERGGEGVAKPLQQLPVGRSLGLKPQRKHAEQGKRNEPASVF